MELHPIEPISIIWPYGTNNVNDDACSFFWCWPKVVLFVRTSWTGFSFHCFLLSVLPLGGQILRLSRGILLQVVEVVWSSASFLHFASAPFHFCFFSREDMLLSQPVSHKNVNVAMIWNNPTVIGHVLLQQSWKSKRGSSNSDLKQPVVTANCN